jgi:hypothetical protein
MVRTLTEREVDLIAGWLAAKCQKACPRCRQSVGMHDLDCSVEHVADREILLIECRNCYYLQFFTLSKVLEKAAALN